MRKSDKTVQEQEAIVAEYLTGNLSFRKLGVKHGVDFRLIHYWVSRFQGKIVTKRKSKAKKEAEPLVQEDLPTDVKQLQEELRKAKLHNKLLNAMIDIAEEQLKIDIRKKSGTKQ
jgi:transposase-like protein